MDKLIDSPPAAASDSTLHADDPHKPLRDDVRLLGTLLGETLRHQEGEALYERVEQVRNAAKSARSQARDRELRRSGARAVVDAADRSVAGGPRVRPFPPPRQHRRAASSRAPASRLSARSVRGTAAGFVDEAFARLRPAASRPTSLHKAVCALRIELVLTAHPTEIMRRTLLYKYGRIADALAGLDRSDATPLEREALVDALQREIQAAWETEDVRRERPSPLEEVRAALTIFDQVLWNAVPEFLRSLDRTSAASPTAICRSACPRSDSARGSAAIATATRR